MPEAYELTPWRSPVGGAEGVGVVWGIRVV